LYSFNFNLSLPAALLFGCSRSSSMASLMLARASSLVLPWLMAAFDEGYDISNSALSFFEPNLPHLLGSDAKRRLVVSRSFPTTLTLGISASSTVSIFSRNSPIN
jgi:hypothetical protein